jgi:hypothetical protein
MNSNSILQEHRRVIEAAINGQDRTQQKRIGPSEIGISCTRCLTLKLAGVEEIREAAWLPWIGTAVHSQLDLAFSAANASYIEHAGGPRFLTETKVSIGHIGGIEITGSSDLLDMYEALVVDFKIVGKSTLDSVKRGGPTDVYRVQGHCYGRGHIRAGRVINTVSILYLPRNAPSLDSAYFWSEPFDESVALVAINRADEIAIAISDWGLASVLKETPPHLGDYSCARYPEGTVTRASQSNEFRDITG